MSFILWHLVGVCRVQANLSHLSGLVNFGGKQSSGRVRSILAGSYIFCGFGPFWRVQSYVIPDVGIPIGLSQRNPPNKCARSREVSATRIACDASDRRPWRDVESSCWTIRQQHPLGAARSLVLYHASSKNWFSTQSKAIRIPSSFQ